MQKDALANSLLQPRSAILIPFNIGLNITCHSLPFVRNATTHERLNAVCTRSTGVKSLIKKKIGRSIWEFFLKNNWHAIVQRPDRCAHPLETIKLSAIYILRLLMHRRLRSLSLFAVLYYFAGNSVVTYNTLPYTILLYHCILSRRLHHFWQLRRRFGKYNIMKLSLDLNAKELRERIFSLTFS